MAITKSTLYSSIWESCDNLRGGMDASQYKDYILVLLFMKYVSDKYADKPNAPIEVPPGGSFTDMVNLKGKTDIGDGINKVIKKLAEKNNLTKVIDVADFNDPNKLGEGKAMQDRLTNLVAIFENPALDFSHNRTDGDDLLGDAYEYLMRNFATQSGKSKGQFYTPAEVSRIIAQVIGIESTLHPNQTLYDPTCGSGSLLLKAAERAPRGITIYGQEMDNATVALAKMNMILHNNPTAEIAHGNTLANPLFKNKDNTLQTFDFAVANPPFSSKSWTIGAFNDKGEDEHNRFTLGMPPPKNGDYAFLLHLLTSMKNTGKGAIILPHGVLFRGNAEAAIRKNIITRGYIKGIIGLPANLFYGTGIPACIIVLDKEHAAKDKSIFMIDASQGFSKDGNKNRLRHQDVHKIVDVFNRQLEIPHYSRMVSFDEIARNEFNLNIPRYIDSGTPEDIQDIAAHLLGGIPDHDIDALAPYWQVFPTLKHHLFAPGPRAGYSQMRVATGEVKPSIFAHQEFVTYTQSVMDCFNQWRERHTPQLRGIDADCHPKQFIQTLAEDLLLTFADVRLIDPYAIYQHLMVYWNDKTQDNVNTMQDDVYVIAADGWRSTKEMLPAPLIIARYFVPEQQAIEKLEGEKEALAQQLEDLDEENGGDDGLLAEVRNEKGEVLAKNIARRLKDILDDPEAEDERTLLKTYQDLLQQESDISRKITRLKKELQLAVDATYATLSVDAVKTLVVDDKWMTSLAGYVQSELNHLSQALTERCTQLAERYATPLPQLVTKADHLSQTVATHLQRMGIVWK